MSDTSKPDSDGAMKRTGITLGAFLIPFVFIWIVFDNIALAAALAFLFSAGSAAAQRTRRKTESDTPQPEQDQD